MKEDSFRKLLLLHSCKIAKLKYKAKKLRSPPGYLAILFLNVDNTKGRELSKILLPKYKKVEEKHFILELFTKKSLCEKLMPIDSAAVKKLKDTNKLAIVIIDHNQIEIHEA